MTRMIKDHYNLIHNDKFVGVYYVFDNHTYSYSVSRWESDIKDCKDLLAQMGLLKDIDSKKPVAAIEAMMKEEYRVAGRKRPIYKFGDFTLKRVPQETNDRFIVYRRDANKKEQGYSDKDHSALHYEGPKG